ncbi:sulfatase-like hydrolase/transferase [Haloterrigena sp. SYSU A558-1]|uniref:Sulfatase-like hydrolase/transferase n=2 Tax=Haloterrigena gelatinilytica TaxID=2741724 RepID=A0ABX2LAK2_9EURY|nr:sulfatase-like hydrolase/transferase [Haloterrigena gelatinilytica]
MDSVRYDYYSKHTVGSPTGPDILDFDVTRFSSAYANAPYTPASVPSFLTGELPLEDGHVMHRDSKTLPEYFNDGGYQTILGYNNVQISRFGVTDEFDIVVDHTQPENSSGSAHSLSERIRSLIGDIIEITPNSEDIKKFGDYWLTDLERRFTSPPPSHAPDESVIDELLVRRDEIEEPFFLWIHMMDTHHPYVFDSEDWAVLTDEPLDRQHHRRLFEQAKLDISVGDYRRPLDQRQRNLMRHTYEASILRANRNVSRLLSEFATPNSVCAITSDHGEELWERGFFGHAAAPSKPRRMTLTEEMIHVPLLLASPSAVAHEVSTPVSLVDLLPTLLDAAGIEVPSALRGRSLLPVVEGGKLSSQPVFAHATSPGDPKTYYEHPDARTLGAVLDGHVKYRWSDDGQELLHDLEEDPSESVDIAGAHGEKTNELANLLRDSLKPYKKSTTTDGIDEKIENQLRDLGYLE